MVKFVDGPSVRVEVSIGASVGDVWPLVADIAIPPRFSDELQRTEWIDEGPALGATFRGFNRNERGFEWDLICTITAFEPERVFEWTVGPVDDRVACWRLEITANSETTSTLVFTAEMGPGPSGMTMAIERAPDREEELIAGRLAQWERGMRATVDGIAALAVGSAPG